MYFSKGTNDCLSMASQILSTKGWRGWRVPLQKSRPADLKGGIWMLDWNEDLQSHQPFTEESFMFVLKCGAKRVTCNCPFPSMNHWSTAERSPFLSVLECPFVDLVRSCIALSLSPFVFSFTFSLPLTFSSFVHKRQVEGLLKSLENGELILLLHHFHMPSLWRGCSCIDWGI